MIGRYETALTRRFLRERPEPRQPRSDAYLRVESPSFRQCHALCTGICNASPKPRLTTPKRESYDVGS